MGEGVPAGLVDWVGEGAGEGRGGGDVGVELVEGGRSGDFIAGFGGDVEYGHLLLQGVGVEVEYPGAWRGFAQSGDPGDVAVGDDDDICSGYSLVDAVPETEAGPVVCRETHVAASCFQNA